MTKQYNSVIFDWSNVCTIEGQSNPMSVYMSKVIGTDKTTVKQAFKKVEDPYVIGKISGEEFIVRILNELKITPDKQTVQKLMPALTASPPIHTELLSHISDLKNSVITILFSDNFLEMSEFIVKKYKLNSIFNYIFFSNRSGFRKPDPKYYEHMINKTNINPYRSIYVDDREKNLMPAQKIGITTILFNSAEDTILKIDQLLNRQVTKL